MEPIVARLVLVAVVVVAATLAGRLWQRRDGLVRAVDSTTGDGHTGLQLHPAHDGPQAVLFGSPTCSPCDVVKQILSSVERQRDDFTWSYVDAAERLDLADQHDVRRVPTLLVIDPHGTVVARTSGVPDRAELVAALPSRETV